MIDFPEYRRLLYLVNDNLDGLLPGADVNSASLSESMRYSLKAGGKRIRPVLLLAACELAGGDTTEALPYACAVEYIHTYSLIHDDLPAMDDDDMRRGAPTNHRVYGEATAILAGDGLLTSAFEVMYKDMFMYFDKPEMLKKRARAAYELSKACGCRGMIAGQIADIEAENVSVSPELLDYIQVNKTAALIRAAAVAGGYIGGAGAELIDSLSAYGENLGLAFQIADDILDVTGEEKELGKATGHDAELRKATWPSVHGMEESRRMMSELTRKAIECISSYDRNTDFFAEIARGLARRTR
ncbi:MAG: polyprenyl synthetase family protein [Clostridiales Family XIII bacterium]|jgi:geranylgeranyl diphosphate synthase type II|nr:polyprenyl synthetase family protein [Clostridiales Family XIII bacterium]